MIKAEQGRTVADADIFDLSQVVAPHIIGHNSKETLFDEQRLKDELIEKATTRLRRRLLEERLSNVMHNVIEMQSQLEFLRVDAAATIDAVAKMDDDDGKCRLEALERRLQAHQEQLNQLKNNPATTTTSETATTEENSTLCDKPTAPSGFSMSRLSSLSLMSSLFSRSNSSSISSHSSYSMEQDDDDDCCSVASFMTEEQQRSHRIRRMRLQRQQQQPYSRSCYMREGMTFEEEESDSSCDDDVLSDIGTLSSASSLSRPRALYEVAPAFAKRLNEHCHPLSPKEYFYEERNVLDDAMSFLDSLSDNADDGGFGQDMDFLLRHPDLCCRPLSEIQGTMTEIQRRESQTTLAQWTQAACAQSWKWYKFLNVLTAAVMISVLKGPDDMLDDRF
ncbi:hypothetical protein LRAMOSA09502 [Lichtheimia ramosa]|uniref:Uncharacterized protein n=1 Tax=Lichtheimia ramosa TaxID=688394 RepID=A0A077WIL5_9FUNG|nr:hypothetical protein LRAMOSA09502 [Lichtheimia ramosa]